MNNGAYPHIMCESSVDFLAILGKFDSGGPKVSLFIFKKKWTTPNPPVSADPTYSFYYSTYIGLDDSDGIGIVSLSLKPGVMGTPEEAQLDKSIQEAGYKLLHGRCSISFAEASED